MTKQTELEEHGKDCALCQSSNPKVDKSFIEQEIKKSKIDEILRLITIHPHRLEGYTNLINENIILIFGKSREELRKQLCKNPAICNTNKQGGTYWCCGNCSIIQKVI